MGGHEHLLNDLICTIIFSLLLSFPVSVESSWRCLGGQEYKITVEQEFEQDFKNGHPNYLSFRLECHTTNSLSTTLDSELSVASKSNGVAELWICGGWFFEPEYKCRVLLLDDGTWDGWFWPLKPEYDCAAKNHHCWWKLHQWDLLRHSPTRNAWIRQDYVIGWSR